MTSPRISATAVAQALGLSEIQVRKDLASISDGGRPGVGYDTQDLIEDISRYLGYDRRVKAVLVGAGNLGRALAGYSGFVRCGLSICAAFDVKPTIIPTPKVGIKPVEQITDYCRKNDVQIGIITVPSSSAQDVCDRLVAGGVRAIWNFAHIHLNVPQGVIVQNENLVASFSVLSRRLSEKIENDQEQK